MMMTGWLASRVRPSLRKLSESLGVHRGEGSVQKTNNASFFFWPAPFAFRGSPLEAYSGTSGESNHHRLPTEPRGHLDKQRIKRPKQLSSAAPNRDKTIHCQRKHRKKHPGSNVAADSKQHGSLAKMASLVSAFAQ